MSAPTGNTNATNWADGHVEALKIWFSQGLSFAQIAAKINAEFQTTYSRNAAIGKASRLGLTQVSKPTPRKQREAITYTRKPRIPSVPKFTPEEIKIRCAEVVPLNLSLIELGEDLCHWPYGDGPFTFCGHPVHDGSYCLAHQALSIHYRQVRAERPDFALNVRKATGSTANILKRLSGIEESA